MDEGNSRHEAVTRANKLFVGNLPFSVTNRDLESTFSAFGEIIGVKLVEDRSTRRFRGFGFVTFKEDASADRALQMNQYNLDGRILTVRRAVLRGTGSLKENDSDYEDEEGDDEEGAIGEQGLQQRRKGKAHQSIHSMTSWSGPASKQDKPKRGNNCRTKSSTQVLASNDDAGCGKLDHPNDEKQLQPSTQIDKLKVVLNERLLFFRRKLKADGNPSVFQLAAFLRSIVNTIKSNVDHKVLDIDMQSMGWQFSTNMSMTARKEPPTIDAVTSWLQQPVVALRQCMDSTSNANKVGCADEEIHTVDFEGRLKKPMKDLLEEYGEYDPNWRDVKVEHIE